MNLEEKAELLALTDLATNLGDGLQVLSAIAIGAAMRGYDKPPPVELRAVSDYAYALVGWKIERVKTTKPPSPWLEPEAVADVKRFVNRKTWAVKIENGSVINPIAATLAIYNGLSKGMRGATHEALNHAIKHNNQLALLKEELVTSLDNAVRQCTGEAMQRLAGAALLAIPDLQTLLLEKLNDE